MANAVSISNLALIRLGQPKISAFTDNVKSADILNELYPNARDTLLRKYPFKFAKKRLILAASASTPEWGFGFEYEMPSDSVRLLNVEGHSIAASNAGNNNDYKLEGNKIRTNQGTSINILYISNTAPESSFDPDFVRVFSLQLALDAFTSLAGRGVGRTRIENEFILSVEQAKLNGSLEEINDEAYSHDWEDSRIV